MEEAAPAPSTSLPERLFRKVDDLHRIQRTLAVLSDRVRHVQYFLGQYRPMPF